jgi:hypothetical protein
MSYLRVFQKQSEKKTWVHVVYFGTIIRNQIREAGKLFREEGKKMQY